MALQACSGPAEPELLASARDFLAKGDRPSAVIQLKSALQANPQSGQARLLLGQTLLEQGNPVEAVVELRKAEDAKIDPALVAPLMARALLQQDDARALVQRFAETSLADAKAHAELKTTLAQAYLRLNQPEPANQALAAALERVPGHAAALMVQARMAAARGDMPAALKLLEQVLAADPKRAEAWLMQAEIQHRGTRDREAALASYRKAVDADATMMPAHQGIVSLLADAGKLDEADAHVAELARTAPNQPVTQLLQAQLAYMRKDYAKARQLVQPLVQQLPNNAIVMQLAGAAAFHLRDMAAAETLLAQAVKSGPELGLARLLLARTLLQTGQPEKALETLEPVLSLPNPLPDFLNSAGEAHLLSGDVRRAEEMFARAVKRNPADARARTALAVGEIRKGNLAAGVASLEAIAATDPGITADLALVAAHMRGGALDKALRALDALERKQPEAALAPNLRGRVQMMRKDVGAARASFEQALARDPGYFPAVASLAALDVAEKKPELARKRFEEVIARDPRNHRAMMSLAVLAASTGRPPAEVSKYLEDAIRAAPGEAAPRVRLVEHQLANGNAKEALSVAQQAVAALPGSREALLAQGRAELANEAWQQAVSSFNKLAAMQPKNPGVPLALADAYRGMKDFKAAESSLQRALELAPTLLPAQRGLIALRLADGRHTEALGVAREVQRQRAAEPAGYVFEGDIERQRRNWDAALAAYRTALQKSRTVEPATRIHATLLSAGRADEAQRFAQGWLKEFPKDPLFRLYMGDEALSRKAWAEAESRYREVLEVQPANAVALNNVAWLMVRQGKPGALELARKANEILPNQTTLMDTMATAMAAEKQLPQALELQKQVVARAPGNPTYRLTLARLHVQAGQKTEARAELERLQKLGRSFPEHAEVAELLKTL